MKISAIKPGQIVFSVEKRDSNVLSMSKSKKRLKTVMVYPVFIKEVNEEEGYVVASWNSNTPKKFYESSVSKWKKEEPMTVKQAFGLVRLATKEEREAAKAVK